MVKKTTKAKKPFEARKQGVTAVCHWLTFLFIILKANTLLFLHIAS